MEYNLELRLFEAGIETQRGQQEQNAAFHAERLKNEQERGELLRRRQQPFYLVTATLKIDPRNAMPARYIASYGDVRAYGATPDEAVQRFNAVWTTGTY